jgi:CubicO group peptidase (beta-lactamase class C family)
MGAEPPAGVKPRHYAFERTTRVLNEAIAAQAFPCAVAEVGRTSGPLWTYATGRLTFAPDAQPAATSTIFDLASLTKVIATATIGLLQVARGTVTLDERLAMRVPHWTGADRQDVTIRDLFEHSSGLPAHRRYFEQLAGRAAYEKAIAHEPLVYPPRTQSLYSDPGFMLLGFLLEDSRGERLDRQFDVWRDAVGISEPLQFNPPASWRDRIAPTEQDPWRERLIVGEVHDENAAALGGVAAHAGLFGTAAAVAAAGRWWLSLLRGHDDAPTGVGPRAAVSFSERSAVPGSSRAVGWDTMLPTSSCGTGMSARAIGHTGFTGTTLWIDPDRDLYFVLLTNRVHPTRNNDRIQPVRRAFHDAAVADLLEPS